MIDPRVANLARILVGYSTRVGEGETCIIEGSTAAEPLVAAVYEEVLMTEGNVYEMRVAKKSLSLPVCRSRNMPVLATRSGLEQMLK